MLYCCMIKNNSISDTQVDSLIQAELQRQKTQICLIPSENIASADIMKAQGSVFMNKYAEGYPAKRYYEGCNVCDDVEQLAIDRACKIFNVKYANVQPHSGSQANQAVFVACLQPGDTILGMDLGSGGHLTHGFKNNMSGTYYNAISYCVDPLNNSVVENADDVNRCIVVATDCNCCERCICSSSVCNKQNCSDTIKNEQKCNESICCNSKSVTMINEKACNECAICNKYVDEKSRSESVTMINVKDCDVCADEKCSKCETCKSCYERRFKCCDCRCSDCKKCADTDNILHSMQANNRADSNTCNTSERINYDSLHALALQHRPKMIIAGGSSYSRNIDWKRLRKIADEVGALLLADIAHTAGMIAAGSMYNPCNDVDIMTCTTHKTLRGPRGGLILTNNDDLIKKINRAIMPGIQGGPMIHTIAAKAVCFGEAMSEEYKKYADQVLINAKIMCNVFKKRGLRIVTNGTDNHLMVIDVSGLGKTGQEIATLLAQHNIIVNKNAIPYDTMGVIKTSGIRIGSPFITSCNFDSNDAELLAEYVSDLILNGESVIDISTLFAKIAKKYDEIETEMMCI